MQHPLEQKTVIQVKGSAVTVKQPVADPVIHGCAFDQC